MNITKSIIQAVKYFRGQKSFIEPWDGIAGTSSRKNSWLEMYHENPRLSVVHKISEDNGSTAYRIEMPDKKSTYKIIGHPLEVELRKHSIPQFFSLWTAYRLMVGVVYIAYDLDSSQNPVDLKIFSKTQLVNETANSYTFSMGNGLQKEYPKTNVIMDLDLDLTKPYISGRGKAEAVKDEIETDELVQRYIKYFYINSARPDVYITAATGDEMSEDDVIRIEQMWLKKFQGVNNAHKPVFLNWDAKVFSVPSSHKDMELLDTRKFYRDTTIQHFGVPPEIMGIVENSNKATVIAAEHIYAKQVRLPILEHFETIITEHILPRYNDSEGMVFKFENILPDDVELNLQVSNEGLSRGALTINEWRRAMGFAPMENGDVLLLPTNVISTPVTITDNEIQTVEFGKVASTSFHAKAEKILGKEIPSEFVVVRGD